MDAAAFHTIVKNYSSLTEDECAQLDKISRDYPYSQLIALLHARALQDQNHPDKEKSLHHAAVYSTERSILKKVMTAPRGERVKVADTPVLEVKKEVEIPKVATAPEPVMKKKAEPVKKVEPAEKIETGFQSSTLSGDALRDDLYRELEKLQKLKQKFAMQVEAFEHSGNSGLKSKVSTVKEVEGDPLIEEIKTTKKKLKIENPKQIEQNEIIDQFIKTKPALPRAKPGEPAEDLSEESGNLGDNVVSETLVNLLIKQGKNDKAVEVLKKLIWKFPQKKAYFAAQIDSLKS